MGVSTISSSGITMTTPNPANSGLFTITSINPTYTREENIYISSGNQFAQSNASFSGVSACSFCHLRES